MSFLKTLKIELACDLVIHLLHFWRIYPKKTKNTDLKRCMHSSVHNSTIYNIQDMETTQCLSRDEWIKMSHTYTHTHTHTHTPEYYSEIKE